MKYLILVALFSLSFLTVLHPTTELMMISDLGSSAAMIARANIEGFQETSSEVFGNPAALHQVNRSSVGFFTTTLIEEITYVNVTAAMRTDIGQFGIGYMSGDVADIPVTIENDLGRFDRIDAFNYKNTLWKAAYQVSAAENVHLGASFTYLYAHAGQYLTGVGMNMDMGALVEFDTVALSLSLKNMLLNSEVNYSNGESERFPFELVLGSKWTLFDSYQFFAQLRQYATLTDPLLSYAILYSPTQLPFIRFSAGMKSYQVLEETRSNYTLGLGLSLSGIDYEYAYEKSEHFEFDGKHYFSLHVSF